MGPCVVEISNFGSKIGKMDFLCRFGEESGYMSRIRGIKVTVRRLEYASAIQSRWVRKEW